METNNYTAPCDITEHDCGFTLCFMTREDKVLMLLREKEPNLGFWNGLGGHIESGENPIQACKREVFEESGLLVNHFHYGGILSWESWYFPPGGIYLFTAESLETRVIPSSEGKLLWHPVNRVLESAMVVENIHYFLPSLLTHQVPMRWHCWFDQKKLLRIETFSLPAWAVEQNLEFLNFGGF